MRGKSQLQPESACQNTIPLVRHLKIAFYSVAQCIQNVKSPVAVVISLLVANWRRRLASGAQFQHQLCSISVCSIVCVPPVGVQQEITGLWRKIILTFSLLDTVIRNLQAQHKFSQLSVLIFSGQTEY